MFNELAINGDRQFWVMSSSFIPALAFTQYERYLPTIISEIS